MSRRSSCKATTNRCRRPGGIPWSAATASGSSGRIPTRRRGSRPAWRACSMATNTSFSCSASSGMSGSWAHRPLPSVNSAGTRTIGCGPGIPATSPSSASMPGRTTPRPTTAPKTVPTSPVSSSKSIAAAYRREISPSCTDALAAPRNTSCRNRSATSGRSRIRRKSTYAPSGWISRRNTCPGIRLSGSNMPRRTRRSPTPGRNGRARRGGWPG